LEAALLSSISPPACGADPTLTIPDSARSQYGSNLTPSGNIFPLVAQIIKASLPAHSKPKSPEASVGDSPLQLDLPADPSAEERVSPTPGKALRLSDADREEVGWSSPPSASSDQEYRRNSERRSKSNHDRPSRKLMLEAAESEPSKEPLVSTPPLVLHQAPAISLGGSTSSGQLLMLDAPIPALGAVVARAPRSRAPPAEALRKSARAKGATEGPVLERAMRATAEKNSMAKVSIEPSASPADNEVAATPSSATPAPGNSFPSSSFVAFQASSVEHLVKVARDSCILFKSADGSPAQAVALLQARERAQAELLAARRKIEEETAKAKEEAARASTDHGEESTCSEGGPEGEPTSGSGKVKKTAPKKKRIARRPTPVGHRPLTRQARALNLVRQ
jgi:hypothetical protein